MIIYKTPSTRNMVAMGCMAWLALTNSNAAWASRRSPELSGISCLSPAVNERSSRVKRLLTTGFAAATVAVKGADGAEFLKLAFMTTLKGENARSPDDPMELYAEEQQRQTQRQLEQANAQWDADER
jgi:hypothetical protein